VTQISTTRPPATIASHKRASWRVVNLAAVAALTAYSAGVSWQAQLVSYPLYRAVSAAEFPSYHLAYNASIPWVVIVPGFLSFLACIAFLWTRPALIPLGVAALIALCGLGSILTTVLWAIPMHDQLDRIGQDAGAIASLIQANALRTGLLTLSAVLLSWCLLHLAKTARAEPTASSMG
jgi:hypothetical protein